MDILSQVEVQCPFCGEVFMEMIDTTEGDCDTIVDCAVCCRPIHLHLACSEGEARLLDADRG